MINQDSVVTSVYDIGSLRDQDIPVLISFGEIWWEESNRQIPISIFLQSELDQFSYAIKNFSTKDVTITSGPCIRLHNLIQKRVKRKSITITKRSR